ncbi:MAG: sigma 54-interacting transcriptional regulator [Desulfohalobiaceae bacterium]|nr:sigma 54-interacting transcriptional regulator [Desulfohalobiaceae bacterium]
MQQHKIKQSSPQEPEASTRSILESISDGVFTVDESWRVTYFNRAAERITGVSREEAIGRPCYEVFSSSMCEHDCALEKTLSTSEPMINKSCFIIDSEGNRIPISVSTAVLRNAQGEITGGAETFRDLSEVEQLRRELRGESHLGDMVSRSPRMRRIFNVLPTIAQSDSSVLIQGETGTGKELLAKAIHSLSHRSEGPFLAVNCGALPAELLESELFGYVRGAFTGADRDKPGRFAVARGGTLFLDEIGEIAPSVQIKLLRVLQEKAFEPLGSNKSVSADVRIITASNRDLEQLVREGGFRSDLFYRINVIRLDLPPLRERKEDIPLLVEQFIQRFNQLQNKSIPGIRSEALSLLGAHDWPGNIRELENVIERAFVLCPDGQFIETAHLPEEFHAADASRSEKGGDIRSSRRISESQAILRALANTNGNRSAAARELGIHKSTLYRKIRALGLEPPQQDGRYRRE